jgi:hypothetical protein
MLDVNAARAANDADIINTTIGGVEALFGERLSKATPTHEEALLIIGEVMMLTDFYPGPDDVSAQGCCTVIVSMFYFPSLFY